MSARPGKPQVRNLDFILLPCPRRHDCRTTTSSSMSASTYRGCAVTAVSVAADGELLDHAGAVFDSWTTHLTDLFIDAGTTSDFATLLIAARSSGAKRAS